MLLLLILSPSHPLTPNTLLTHHRFALSIGSYWLGSQQMGGTQLYQYRLVLAGEEHQLNVASDMDLNLDAELRSQLSGTTSSKASAVVSTRADNAPDFPFSY